MAFCAISGHEALLCHWSRCLSASISTELSNKLSTSLVVWTVGVCVPHSTQTTMSTLANLDDIDCSKICIVACKFQQHADQSRHWAHHELNTQCTGIITDIEGVLSAKDKDIPVLITVKVIECMSEQQAAQLKLHDLFEESAIDDEVAHAQLRQPPLIVETQICSQRCCCHSKHMLAHQDQHQWALLQEAQLCSQ